jgi:APA family basic amino acid/polyamine antiporter
MRQVEPAVMDSAQFQPRLGLFDSATIVAGSMIGSGIFIVSADIARQLESPFGLLAVWLLSGLMTIAGALAYGELAAMMPQAGGQYVFIREAYGGAPAFAYGWTMLLVIQTGTIAAVAVAFARFGGVFLPALGSRVWLGYGGIGLSGERLGAMAVIAALTAVNLRGLDLSRRVQNSFTVAKLGALLLIIVAGCWLAPNALAIKLNFEGNRIFGVRAMSWPLMASFGAAMVGGLFSSDAWADITFAAAEVRDPHRNLPRALALGAGTVVILYLLVNIAYLRVLPVAGSADAAGVFGRGIAHAQNDRVASAMMQAVWGARGAAITALLVMVSTFGCANGLILTGARVVYAMARDGVFFPSVGELNANAVPAKALLLQGGWAALLTLSGTYSELLDYVIFAQLLFYVLTVAAVFVMRWRRPDAPRPYRAWGYPLVPLAYIVSALALMGDLLYVKPAYTWPGLLIALSGLPIYWSRMRWGRRGTAGAPRRRAS